MLKDMDIRVELDNRDEKLSYKMRESQTRKMPYTLIIGDKERDNNEVSYRIFGSQETTTLSVEDFKNRLVETIKSKKQSK